ncbi:hypothetical protein BOX37_30420 [Nocardia mangyaensis]|uniref:DNA-binding response regulator n=1 Tax=Nocardia mangyaensis TaxID=2213200 RepID=A0A1J0VZN8_9NOCA|nr:response regulator transcription factor [Nocardia mangyaensis]APE37532.1 hypothetical protein BOX37_30420 [Nocardia mangyaensis]
MTIRVLLADDEAMIRAGIRAILGTDPGIEVVAEAADGHAAVESALAHRPDVVLMDVRMPRLDGLAAAAELRTAAPEIAVVARVGRGLSNQDIATELFLAEATVKAHVSTILRRLALRNRVQAAILAHEAGLSDS